MRYDEGVLATRWKMEKYISVPTYCAYWVVDPNTGSRVSYFDHICSPCVCDVREGYDGPFLGHGERVCGICGVEVTCAKMFFSGQWSDLLYIYRYSWSGEIVIERLHIQLLHWPTN